MTIFQIAAGRDCLVDLDTGPIAADLLCLSFGLLLSAIIAGAAMSFSSVSVIANALRLKAVSLA